MVDERFNPNSDQFIAAVWYVMNDAKKQFEVDFVSRKKNPNGSRWWYLRKVQRAMNLPTESINYAVMRQDIVNFAEEFGVRYQGEAKMKVSVDQTVQVSDTQRVQIANVIDDKVSKRIATRDEMKQFIWKHGEDWEIVLCDQYKGLFTQEVLLDDENGEELLGSDLEDLL